MSAYRTLSATDLKADKLNFTVKGSYDHTFFGTNSPRSFFFIDDNLSSSQTSLISSLDYPSRPSTPLPAVVHPKPVIDTNPPTIVELKNQLNGLFTKNSLKSWMEAELFAGSNLSKLHEILQEHRLNEVDYGKLSDNDFNSIIILLDSITTTMDTLINHVDSSNSYLKDNYDSIIQSLKLEILTNFRVFKNFENSRNMFDALIAVKDLFQDLGVNNYGSDLDVIVNELIDKIFDYNNFVEDLHFVSKSNNDCTVIFEKINYIKSNLSKKSKIMSEGCGQFQDCLHNFLIGFKEYTHKLVNCKLSNGEVFTYEIASFDDHIKSQL